MAIFAAGLSRPVVLTAAVTAFRTIPTTLLARGPNLCIWRYLFHINSCPGCGSTRALAAFFHSHFAQAMAFNPNVFITGPLILLLLGSDLIGLARQTVIRRVTPGTKDLTRAHRSWGF